MSSSRKLITKQKLFIFSTILKRFFFFKPIIWKVWPKISSEVGRQTEGATCQGWSGCGCDKFSVTNLDTLLLDILLLCFLKYVELPKQHSAGKNPHYPFSFKGNGRTSTKIWGNLSVWDTKSHCAFEWSVAKDSGPDTISTFSLNERSQQQQI